MIVGALKWALVIGLMGVVVEPLGRWEGGQRGEHGVMRVQEVHSGPPGIAEGGAVVPDEVRVSLGDGFE